MCGKILRVLVVAVLLYLMLELRLTPCAVAAEPIPQGEQIVSIARTQLGALYLWGAMSPGRAFDCSGLTQWVYAKVGVYIPRTADDQFDTLLSIEAEQHQPGDLIFFQGTYGSGISHVGIYTEPGKMIHMSSRGCVEESLNTYYWYYHYAGSATSRSL